MNALATLNLIFKSFSIFGFVNIEVFLFYDRMKTKIQPSIESYTESVISFAGMEVINSKIDNVLWSIRKIKDNDVRLIAYAIYELCKDFSELSDIQDLIESKYPHHE